MQVLALETSTEYCSVALWRDGVETARCALAGQRHSELLIAMLDEVLVDAGVALRELDGIAFGSGPGSFTGVRIACGAAQGLALGASLPVVGVCTLQALAEASGHERVIAILDARMKQVYHAAYEKRDGQWQTVTEPALCLPQDAPPVEGSGWFGAGSGFSAHGAELRARYGDKLAAVDEKAVPQATAIARLAADVLAKGGGVDAALAVPLYLREKVALKTVERQ